MSQKVLVVDDEAHIRELVSLYLTQAGFETVEASSGREALELAHSARPDLVILDLMLPERDGWEVCRELRMWGDIPVIMLTAKDAGAEKLLGFALGADDYVTKPFEPRELVARVRAVLRRTEAGRAALGAAGGARGVAPGEAPGGYGAADPSSRQGEGQRVPPILDFGSFRLDRVSRELEVHGREVPCPAKEFDLLWLLASHPDRVFTREELLSRVWGYDYFGDLRTVDVHIRRIRQKVEPRPEEPRFIVTVWGVGYKFKLYRNGAKGWGQA